jgi:hypothetical protein
MEVYVCSATTEDVASILRISDGVYCGLDYVEHCLSKWMEETDDTRISLVLKEKGTGNVVGFRTIR